jgi:hypothetical protein
MWKFIVSLILVIIGLIIIKSMDYKKRFNFYLSRLDITNTKLKDSLIKKYDLMLKQIKLLKNKKKLNEDDFEEFIDINKKEIDVLKLDNIINTYEKKIDIIFQNNNKLVKDNTIRKNINDIEKISITITALKKYYNMVAIKYNHYIHKFPSRYVAKIGKYKDKEKYEVEDDKEKS